MVQTSTFSADQPECRHASETNDGAVEGAGDTAQCPAHMPVFIYNMKYTWARRLYAWSEGTFQGQHRTSTRLLARGSRMGDMPAHADTFLQGSGLPSTGDRAGGGTQRFVFFCFFTKGHLKRLDNLSRKERIG